MPLMVELCAGTGVLAATFRRAGWRTLTVDVDASHRPDVVADLRELRDLSELGDLSELAFVWAAPPCAEFSRTFMPWMAAAAPVPSLELVEASLRLIRSADPPWWAIENVKGALRWFRPLLGEPRASSGGRAVYLWGALPPLRLPAPRREDWKERRTSGATVARASYPAAVCDAVVASIDAAVRLGIR
jgi:hypothetical protein